MGRSIARLAARMRPGERHLALANLAQAFPEVDANSRMKIFHDSVDALGENFFDTLIIPRLVEIPGMVTEELGQEMLPVVEEIDRLAQYGKGVLILTGHLGCWELLGSWVARQMAATGQGTLAVVTGTVHNVPVNNLLQQRRRKMGLKILPRQEGAAPLLQHLRSGSAVAVLLDQNTAAENLPVLFFGREAPTPVGLARIALRGGIPILPVVLARSGNGHIIRRGPAWIPTSEGIDSEDSLKELLLWCNQSLENFIRRNPNEWVWFHKRWS